MALIDGVDPERLAVLFYEKYRRRLMEEEAYAEIGLPLVEWVDLPAPFQRAYVLAAVDMITHLKKWGLT